LGYWVGQAPGPGKRNVRLGLVVPLSLADTTVLGRVALLLGTILFAPVSGAGCTHASVRVGSAGRRSISWTGFLARSRRDLGARVRRSVQFLAELWPDRRL